MQRADIVEDWKPQGLVPDPVMFALMVLGGVAVLFLLTFAARIHDVCGPHASYLFTAKLAVGLAAGASLAYLMQYYFPPSPVRAIYITLLGLIGLFVLIVVTRFRCFTKEK